MVATENNGKLAVFGVHRYDISHLLANSGYESRVLHLANWGVILLGNLFKLVVSVK
jgi:hypothetical protein